MQSHSQNLQSQSSKLLSLGQAIESNDGSLQQQHLHWQDSSSEVHNRKLKPHSIQPLFEGGDFDGEYNSKYKPVEFEAPSGTQKAFLEAVVTGILDTLINY